MTKGKFKIYHKIQMSGITSMYNIERIINFSRGKLTKEDCLDIMANYKEYEEKWL